MRYLGHSADPTKGIPPQSLIDHLEGVVRLATARLRELGIPDTSYVYWLTFWAALYHDVGKAQAPFQSWITDGRFHLPHALYSARCLLDLLSPRNLSEKDLNSLLYLVANHHQGFHESVLELIGDTTIGKKGRIGMVVKPRKAYWQKDWNSNSVNLFRDVCDEVARWIPEFQRTRNLKQGCVLEVPPQAPKGWEFYLDFKVAQGAIRYGDCVDTSTHYKNLQPSPYNRDILLPLSDVCDSIRDKYRKGATKEGTSPQIINLRNTLFDLCSKPRRGRFFTVSACTGSGKTLASLKLAATLKAKKVIYVLPFLSLVEQNSKFLRKSVGICEPLEHVSVPSSEFSQGNKTFQDYIDDWKVDRRDTADWNAPLIITTTERVSQLLFGRKGGDARRFLSLLDPDTVLIFDEIQAVPPHKLYAYIQVLKRLPCKVVFTSATLESGEAVIKLTGTPFEQITPPGSLPPIPPRRRFLFARLPRYSFPNVDKAMKKLGVTQALSIYNTVKQATRAFQKARLPDSYLLTSRLCAKHRLKILAEIQKRLDDKLPVVMFSTQVIQCGVDISFPLVLRQIAPYSDVLQAAGRDNRHGELGVLGGTVIIWAWPHPYKMQVALEGNTEKINVYPDEDYCKRAEIFYNVLVSKFLTSSTILDDGETEALAPIIVQKETHILRIEKGCAKVDKLVNGRELEIPELTKLTQIPDDDQVQTLVDYPSGIVRQVLQGQIPRSQFHLHTVEARAKKGFPNHEHTVQFPKEDRPTKIHVWGKGDPFGKWDGLYDQEIGRKEFP